MVNALIKIIQFAYPIHIQDSQPAVTVKWPFAEQTVVGWGGDSTDNNLPHVIWASERWAYDLVMEPYNMRSVNLEDYGVWNREVLAHVGNSGSTSEPHLHIHHQRQDPTTTLHPILAEGLPLYFEATDADAMPLKGTIVTPAK